MTIKARKIMDFCKENFHNVEFEILAMKSCYYVFMRQLLVIDHVVTTVVTPWKLVAGLKILDMFKTISKSAYTRSSTVNNNS